jgi:MYXO-CTERM domain-containing protein
MRKPGLLALCVLVLLARAAHAQFCSSPSLRYYGGPIMANPKIYQVNWSSSVNSTLQSMMPTFYTALVKSTYLDLAQEYDTVGVSAMDSQPGTSQTTSHGSFAGSVTLTPSLCAGTVACTITDDQIKAELNAHIDSGVLAPPTLGCDGQINTIYSVSFPVNVKITQGSNASCQLFCNYHNSNTHNGTPYAYLVLPDVLEGPCDGGCGTHTNKFDNATSVASHTVMSAITDPRIGEVTSSGIGRPAAWYIDQCGEIGDPCNMMDATITVDGGTYTVQKLWSNAANACVSTLPAAAVKPICLAVNTPPSCRACSCADDHQDAVGCGGAKPVCDVMAGSATLGECVAAAVGGAGGGGAGAGGGTAGSSGAGAAGSAGGGGAPGLKKSGGCQVATPGVGSSSGALALLLGLALFVRARRR